MGPTKGGLRYAPDAVARRVRGAGDVDDVEVRAARPALRRREGRRALRPAARSRPTRSSASRAATPPSWSPIIGPDRGHPGARHGHRRARDGVVLRHLLAGGGPRGAGDRDRQAGRRSAAPTGAPAGDRPRRRLRARGGARAARLAARRAARRDPGLRQRRRGRGGGAARARRAGRRGSATSAGAIADPAGLDVPAVARWSREHGIARGLPARRRRSSATRCSSCRATCSSRRRSSTRSPSENAPRLQLPPGRRGRERPDDARRPTRSSPSAASPCCPTCSPTAAA